MPTFLLPRDSKAAIEYLTPTFEQLQRWADEVREQDPQLSKLRKECRKKLAAKKAEG